MMAKKKAKKKAAAKRVRKGKVQHFDEQQTGKRFDGAKAKKRK